MAAKRAVEFARVVLIDKNLERGYELLSDGGKRHVPLDKFKQTIVSMNARGYPSRVTATEYEPMAGEKAIYIFLRAQNGDEQVNYRVTLEGTAATDYKVLKIDQGAGFPTLSIKNANSKQRWSRAVVELINPQASNPHAFRHSTFPPCTAPEMAAYAKRAMAQYAFDKVWVPDHLTYENVFVILAAIIGQTNAHVGTSVVQPFSRTPVDLASSFAALAHLAGERGVTVGIGAGSPSSDMIRKRNRVGIDSRDDLVLRGNVRGTEKSPSSNFRRSRNFFTSIRWRKPSCACRRQNRRIFLRRRRRTENARAGLERR